STAWARPTAKPPAPPVFRLSRTTSAPTGCSAATAAESSSEQLSTTSTVSTGLDCAASASSASTRRSRRLYATTTATTRGVADAALGSAGTASRLPEPGFDDGLRDPVPGPLRRDLGPQDVEDPPGRPGRAEQLRHVPLLDGRELVALPQHALHDLARARRVVHDVRARRDPLAEVREGPVPVALDEHDRSEEHT